MDIESIIIKNSFKRHFRRYGWDGVYSDLLRKGYKRGYSGMIYAGKRMGLVELKESKKKQNFKKISGTVNTGRKRSDRCERSAVQLSERRYIERRKSSLSMDGYR